MTAFDPRTTAARDDLAAESLRGVVPAKRYVAGRLMEVARGSAPLRHAPEAGAILDNELLFGDRFTVYDEQNGWAWGQAEADRYVGYVPAEALRAPASAPTHRIVALASHLYPVDDFKAPPILELSFGARFKVVGEGRRFLAVETAAGAGFVPAKHAKPLGDLDHKLVSHDQRTKASAAGSMDTTISDWSKFLAAVVRGDGLSAHSKAEMIRLQITIDSVTQFPTLRPETTDAYKAIKLGYGLGWGTFETPFGHAFFKEGHDDGTANYALCIEPRRACLLLLSNDLRAEQIFKLLSDSLMGETQLPWAWEGYTAYDQMPAAP